MLDFPCMGVQMNRLSVFFPTYNEGKNIEKVVINTKKVLEKVAKTLEIIIVNDGSNDNTKKVAERLSKSDKRIRVSNHKVNRGYGGALKTGFKSAKYPWVAFTDADGQFDFSEISKLIKHTKNADLVLGYRLQRADSLARKIYTSVWALIPRIIFGMNVKDYSCGFKLIKKKVFEDIQPLVGEEKVTQIEMLVKAQRKGFKFTEVGVHHYPREYGSQTGANLSVVFKSIKDLVKLWRKIK